MRAVWLCVRAELRQGWRSPLVLALITGLMGALVLVSLAGARRTDTAVPRFLAWSGPTEGGSDDATAAAAAERGTSLQALALLLFGIIVALALLVIVGQSVARLALTAAEDFPVLRTLGCSRAQLAVALAPGALVAAAGMALAVPAAYALSVFTPIGLARRAEISPGFSFDAPVLLGGAALLTLLLTARTALTAQRVAWKQADTAAAERGRGSRIARWMARRGLPAPAVAGFRLAFEPGGDRTPVPIRSAVLGTVLALAAVMAALVFGASLAHVIGDPRLAGWNWDVAVGNPHSGDTAAQTIPKLRADASLAGFTATALGDGAIGGQDVPVVGIQPLRGLVAPPLLDGRLPRGPREIALSGGELRALHRRVGGLVRARTTRGAVTLRITGQIVLSPEITNEQVKLGTGGVMTLAGAQTLSRTRLPVNVYLVRMRHPGDPAAIARLKREFPGVVLPAIRHGGPGTPGGQRPAAHPGLRADAAGRGHDRAHPGDIGAPAAPGPGDPQGDGVRQPAGPGHVAWQASAIAATGLVIGLPLGVAAGRWAWTLLARGFAIEPVPVISALVLLSVPAVLLMANLVAAVPARAAARTRPAVVAIRYCCCRRHWFVTMACWKCTVVITGPEDLVVDGSRRFVVKNGHPLMSRVVGTGCMAASVIGTFAAVEPDLALAAAAGLICFNVAGELAAELSPGPGTFKVKLFDCLDALDEATLAERRRVSG